MQMSGEDEISPEAWVAAQDKATRIVRKRRTLMSVLGFDARDGAGRLKGAHAWSIVAACDGRHRIGGSAAALWPLLVCFVMEGLQGMLLIFAVMDATYPTCTRHSDCREGQWCAP